MVRTPAPGARRRRIVVVGGGPAGLMAAETAAQAGCEVVVFERMPSAGRKLLMAGRGGLNLTHSETLEAFLRRYGAARGKLETAIRAFPPEALVAWAASLGQETFIGSSGRIFPRSMKASPLLRAWLARLADSGVAFRLRHRLLDLLPDGKLILATDAGARVEVVADAIVLALGGASWPRLGSDGQWADILRSKGIVVGPFAPSNSGVVIPWGAALVERHVGAPLKRISLTCRGEIVRGEVMITAAGLEGGAVYALSPILRGLLQRDGAAALYLDLRPDMAVGDLTTRLSSARKGDSRANVLRKAGRLSPAAIAVLRDATANELPAEPAALAALIKALPLEIRALADLEKAISTAGGIAWSEIDDETYMLKRLPGVFCAGEMLDWEAPTGGYLLQACFATGRAAGHGASTYLADDCRVERPGRSLRGDESY